MAMGSVNQVTLMGNLGKDPEIRRLQDGTPICHFSIATSEGWRDKQTGERKERTEWHNIVVWGKAEGGGLVGYIEKYAAKGDKVILQGKLQTRKWQDAQGADRWSTEVVIRGFGDSFQIITSKAMEKNRVANGGTASDGPPLDTTPGREESFGNVPPSGGAKGGNAFPDDDIPF